MRALLILATILDLALAVLLIAISGFILEGVNGGGAMMPEAILFWLMLAACLIAPAVGWWLRARAGLAFGIAGAPLIVAVLALVLEPAFF